MFRTSVGFGSCHSFGVAWVGAAMACAKSEGENLSTVAVRWAGCGTNLYSLAVSQVLFFVFCPALHEETFTSPRGKSLLVECHPLIFFLSVETSLGRLGRHCPRCWKGIGANISIAAIELQVFCL
jgi:hypothetical protein